MVVPTGVQCWDPTLEEAGDSAASLHLDLADVLADEDVRDMARLNAGVAEALPPLSSVPAGSFWRDGESPEDWEAFLSLRRGPSLEELRSCVELRLYTRQDVEVWGRWLAARVPALEERLDTRWPTVGRVRPAL